MTQIMRETILIGLAPFNRIVQHFAHPEPGFCQHIMRPAHINGTVQIAARRFLLPRLRFNNSTAQVLLSQFSLYAPQVCDLDHASLSFHRIRHFCNPRHFLHVMHADHIRAAHDAQLPPSPQSLPRAVRAAGRA